MINCLTLKKFKINNEFCFDKYEDLISLSGVDIIYIALPNSLHAKYVQYSIINKKIFWLKNQLSSTSKN